VIQQEGQTLDASKMEEAYCGHGQMIDSGDFSGLASLEGLKQVAQALAKKGLGGETVNYRLRDWGVSRQRYWGTPIPIIYCDQCGPQLVPDKDLPVKLPEDVEFLGTGGSPLAKVESFVKADCPKCKKPGRRETDTLDTFVESSWYFLRYLCPRFDQGMLDQGEVDYWMPVDMYIGGIEHAVGHLIYARYFSKLLRDQGLLSFDEPFSNLITQGMVCKDGEKMSKSKGNVVDPDPMIDKYGADTVRLFMLFASPVEKDIDWNERGVEGLYRFFAARLAAGPRRLAEGDGIDQAGQAG